MSIRRLLVVALIVLAGSRCSLTTPPKTAAALQGPQGEIGLVLPVKEKSLRFGIIGDTGSGGLAQYQVATEMARWRAKFPFELVLLLGDNMYGADGPSDYKKKFEAPYKALLDAGVKFYASLGNHDSPNQRFYKQFNMAGERYYTFKGSVASVRFFALDSNYIDEEQLAWLEKELQGSASDWKICYFHHPLYSSGRMHGPSVDKREVLEPLLEKYKVDVVFSGHEHFYERIKPQKGVHYFISGAGGKLRSKNIGKTEITEKGYDEDFHFMLVEITGDEMYFQTISRVGTTVDSGVIRRVPQQG